jgi:hypothetical protein
MTKILLAIGPLFLQAPEPDAPEEGKPLQCDNFRATAPAHRCTCDRAMQNCSGLPQSPATGADHEETNALERLVTL